LFWEERERETKWGGEEVICSVLKVPRQCPLVLLVEVMHIIGIFMTFEGFYYSEI
jgi:hypothetical protein